MLTNTIMDRLTTAAVIFSHLILPPLVRLWSFVLSVKALCLKLCSKTAYLLSPARSRRNTGVSSPSPASPGWTLNTWSCKVFLRDIITDRCKGHREYQAIRITGAQGEQGWVVGLGSWRSRWKLDIITWLKQVNWQVLWQNLLSSNVTVMLWMVLMLKTCFCEERVHKHISVQVAYFTSAAGCIFTVMCFKQIAILLVQTKIQNAHSFWLYLLSALLHLLL